MTSAWPSGATKPLRIRSPRAVRLHEAAMGSAVVPPGGLKVGVFVNEPAESIRSIVEAARLDVVQLHGSEKPDDCAALDGLRVWKALAVGPKFDPSEMAAYPVEAFLLDTPAGDAYGGTGKQFPWAKAAEAKRHGKVIVAGGLEGDNVRQVIAEVDPWGVDSSSRLETEPGVKDPERVKAYVSAARGDASLEG